MILDGLEALIEDPDLPMFLEWLPLYLPENINLIVTYTYDRRKEEQLIKYGSLLVGANSPIVVKQVLRKKFKGNPNNETETTNTFLEILPLKEVCGTKQEFKASPLIEYYLNKANRSLTKEQTEVFNKINN